MDTVPACRLTCCATIPGNARSSVAVCSRQRGPSAPRERNHPELEARLLSCGSGFPQPGDLSADQRSDAASRLLRGELAAPGATFSDPLRRSPLRRRTDQHRRSPLGRGPKGRGRGARTRWPLVIAVKQRPRRNSHKLFYAYAIRGRYHPAREEIVAPTDLSVEQSVFSDLSAVELARSRALARRGLVEEV